MVLLALSAMSPGAQAVFFFIAFVCFVVAAIAAPAWVHWPRFIAIGLACVALVWFWNSAAAS